MTVHVDTRPPGVDLMFRPGNSFTLQLTWPQSLTGRTFTSSLSSQNLSLTYSVTSMTIVVSDTQSDDFSIDVPLDWALTESSSDLLIGTWVPSFHPNARGSASANVVIDSSPVEINYASSVELGDLIRRVDLLESPHDNVGPFIELPSGWGRRWFGARESARLGNSLATVVQLGDSIAVGWDADTNWWNGYGTQVGEQLQVVYGNGGRGFIGVDFARHTGNNLISGNPVASSGNAVWTTVENDTASINAHSVRPTTDGNNATMTFTMVTDDTVIIYSRTDPTYGRYDYRINGGTAVQVPQNVAAGIQATTVSVSSGTNTIQIIAASGTCRMLGVKSENSTGLAYHNMSVAGRSLDDIASTFAALAATFNATGEPDLVVVTLGVNDVNTSGLTETNVDADIDFILRSAKSTNLTNPPDLAVVIQHRGNVSFGDFFGVWPGVYSGLRKAAVRNGAAIVDVWAYGRRTWEYWNNLGFFSDSVHPTQLGHDAYAEIVTSALTVTSD